MLPVRFLLPAVNHVLAQAHWACERLRPFAGALVRVSGGALKIDLTITGEGLLAWPEAPVGEADVTLSLPGDFPLRLLVDREKLFADVRLAGPVELAEALGFVFRNLSWDYEGDLAERVGDIAAHRLVRGGQALAHGLREAAVRTRSNVEEYLLEESPLLVPQHEFRAFCDQLEKLQAETEHLALRLRQLG